MTRLVLTHAHPDHAGGAAHVAARTGRSFDVHEGDAPYAREGKSPPRDRSFLLGRLFDRVAGGQAFTPVPVERELTDGEVLPVAGGLRVVHTPGHSPGHISLLHEETRLLITGDAIFNVRRLRWPIRAFCTDFAMTQRTAVVLGELDYDVAAFTHGPELRGNPREAIRGVPRARARGLSGTTRRRSPGYAVRPLSWRAGASRRRVMSAQSRQTSSGTRPRRMSTAKRRQPTQSPKAASSNGKSTMTAPIATTAVIAAEDPVTTLRSQSAVAATVMTAPMVAAKRFGAPAVGRFAAGHGGSDPPVHQLGDRAGLRAERGPQGEVGGEDRIEPPLLRAEGDDADDEHDSSDETDGDVVDDSREARRTHERHYWTHNL